MLIGILPDASHAETLLNNLSEADFDLAQVSVLMKDVKTRNAIAKDAGPFKGANPKNVAGMLVKAGLPQAQAKPYSDAVAQGKVLVAIVSPAQSQPAAQEMLQDHSAELIQALG